MKLIEHVYAIKNILSHGVPSEDFSFSNRLISHLLQSSRARLIKQKTDKYNFISDQSNQSLCVTLALSDYHDCCDVASFGCQILESVSDIPKFLTSRWGNLISVTTLDGVVIPEITVTQNKFAKYGLTKPTSTTGWFMRNNKIFILNNIYLEKILLNAIFDNPDTIYSLNCNTSTSSTCGDFMDQEFPVDSDLVDPMYRLTIELLIQSMKLPIDYEADSRA